VLYGDEYDEDGEPERRDPREIARMILVALGEPGSPPDSWKYPRAC